MLFKCKIKFNTISFITFENVPWNSGLEIAEFFFIVLAKSAILLIFISRSTHTPWTFPKGDELIQNLDCSKKIKQWIFPKHKWTGPKGSVGLVYFCFCWAHHRKCQFSKIELSFINLLNFKGKLTFFKEHCKMGKL